MNIDYCSKDYVEFREMEVRIVLISISKLLKGFDFGLEVSTDLNFYFVDEKTNAKFKVPADKVKEILSEVEIDT